MASGDRDVFQGWRQGIGRFFSGGVTDRDVFQGWRQGIGTFFSGGVTDRDVFQGWSLCRYCTAEDAACHTHKDIAIALMQG